MTEKTAPETPVETPENEVIVETPEPVIEIRITKKRIAAVVASALAAGAGVATLICKMRDNDDEDGEPDLTDFEEVDRVEDVTSD